MSFSGEEVSHEAEGFHRRSGARRRVRGGFAAQGAFCQMGRVYVIDQEDGTSVSETIPTPDLSDAGVDGWTIQALVDSGSEFYI